MASAPAATADPSVEQGTRMRMNQAITAAMEDAMREDPSVVLIGEDVGSAGGVFKTSVGMQEEFGALRVRDTPISEMAFSGVGVGAAAAGLRPIVEIMFAEFYGVALDQITTQAAKLHYLTGGTVTVPIVFRGSVGAGRGFSATHSATLESWFLATAGLRLVVPSSPQSAYGLLRAAIRDEDPVVMLEHKLLYGQRDDVVRGEAGIAQIGRAERLREGTDVTVVGLGYTTTVVERAAEMLQEELSVEVIDLLTLRPWDRATVLESAARTGRLVIVEENPPTGGWGTTIAAAASSELFGQLRAPVLRITTPDVPVPFNKALELERFLPTADYVVDQLRSLCRMDALPAPWWKDLA